jgi:ribosomal protein S18 acetylase RimI-like enzyme
MGVVSEIVGPIENEQREMYYIRWGVNKDLQALADIDETVYGPNEGMSVREFQKLKIKQNVIILVVDNGVNDIYGYVIYKRNKTNIEIVRMAVDPAYQQKGIGTEMIHKLMSRLKKTIPRIVIAVEDNYTVAHLFLKKFGFNCYKVLWGDSDERDLYLFEYVIPELAKRG